MEHQEQFRNSKMIILLCSLLTGCFFTDKQPAYNYVVNAADIDLKQVADQIYYRDTLLNGEVYAQYENGDTAFLFSYARGKLDGVQLKWYPNKQKAEQRVYKEGKKEGTHYGWWPNGTKKFEYQFAGNEHHGYLKEWFENGRPARVFQYNAGYEVNNQKMWWPDGSLRANYDVRNGKRFGLQGEKLCQKSVTNDK